MSYCMRFIQTDDLPISAEILETAMRDEHPDYSLRDDGALCFGDQAYAELHLCRRGESRFEREVAALRERVEAAIGRNKQRVLGALEDAQAIVAVQVVWADREPEETLQTIDPLWQWLFSNCDGLVQADEEGYYVRSKCILEVA